MYSYYREKFTVDHLSINGLLRRNFEQQDNEIISLIFFFAQLILFTLSIKDFFNAVI